jgi:hypothetical protein
MSYIIYELRMRSCPEQEGQLDYIDFIVFVLNKPRADSTVLKW